MLLSFKIPGVRKACVSVLLGAVTVVLAGCAADRPADVPKAAALKTAGNQRVVYVAENDGTVWVTEPASNQIVWSGPVARGDRVLLDPVEHKLVVNQRVVADKGIGAQDHKIFFLPGEAPPSPSEARAVEAARDAAHTGAVPATALLRGEGRDRVEFTAPQDGTVWVTDTDARDSVIYAGRVRRGDVLVIDPHAPRDLQMTVAGRPAMTGDLPNHNRRVYFLPGGDLNSPYLGPGSAVPADRPVEVPAAARVVQDATGRTEFAAADDGTVWVVDATTGRVVYSGRVVRGDALTIDPPSNRLTLNGRPAAEGNVPTGDRYRVYFRSGL